MKQSSEEKLWYPWRKHLNLYYIIYNYKLRANILVYKIKENKDNAILYHLIHILYQTLNRFRSY